MQNKLTSYSATELHGAKRVEIFSTKCFKVICNGYGVPRIECACGNDESCIHAHSLQNKQKFNKPCVCIIMINFFNFKLLVQLTKDNPVPDGSITNDFGGVVIASFSSMLMAQYPVKSHYFFNWNFYLFKYNCSLLIFLFDL